MPRRDDRDYRAPLWASYSNDERCADCRGILSRLRAHECLYPKLLAALPAGLVPTEEERRYLKWLAGKDGPTADAFVSLFQRIARQRDEDDEDC